MIVSGLPARLIPATIAHNQPLFVIDASTTQTINGNLTITTGGSVIIAKTSLGTIFTNAGTCGHFPTSFTYDLS